MAQYVYTMIRVGKIVPPKREILKNISLSFFPGAKIGVLGLNGSGKSTLLRIMAGLDKDIEGEAVPMPGLEHRLPAAGAAARPCEDGEGRSRGRAGRSHAGQAEARRDLRGLCRARCGFRQALGGAGQVRGDHRHVGGRRRAPDGDRRRCAASAAVGRGHRASFPAARSAASRCASCCCPSPTCCCWTNRPTTSTPRASTGSSSSCRASRAPWSRSRTTATSSTTPPSGFSNSTAAWAFRGRATTARGWNRRKSGSSAKPSPRRPASRR